MPDLRDYQRRIFDGARSGNVLIVAPTGAGKTIVLAELARVTPGRVIVVCPWRTLIPQTAAALRSLGVPCSTHAAGVRGGQERVQVASLETLARRKLPAAELVIVDEAHRVDTARRRQLIAQHVAPGGRVVGATATPWTERGPLPGYDRAAVGPSPAELIDRRLLRRPRFYRLDWRAGLARLDTRARALVFVPSVAESKRWAAEARAAGLDADHVDGSQRGSARAGVLEGFSGPVPSPRVVFNCAVLTEGFDSTIDGCALRPMNLRLFVQAVGRSIRPNGDREAAVFDAAGTVARYGSPVDLPWPLWAPSSTPVPYRVASCRECAELVPAGAVRLHRCRESWGVQPGDLQLVAAETGLGAVWLAEQLAARGFDVGPHRAAVAAELELQARARGLGPGWVAGRLLALAR